MSTSSQRFVADNVSGLPRSGIRDFFAIVSAMPQAISLGIGEPDFVTPWHIREAAIFALEQGKTSYTDNLGLIRLRKEISTYVEKNFDLSYHPEKEVLVAVGVSEALDIALRAVLNPGDKVLYHEPCYVSYMPSIKLTHAEPIAVATSAEDQFGIDPDRVAEAWQPGCKVLILNFPTNPTGGVTERAKLEKLAKFAVEKDLLVISDEIYSELTFEGKHTSIASLPGMQDRTIFLHGFSKAFAMTGFRIGYACGPQPLIEAMMKIHQYSMLCAPILSQEAAIEALKNGAPAVEKMKEAYHRRRDLIVRRFNEVGLDCHSPKGSFYAFPSIQSSGMNSIDFCKGLLEDQEVAIVPGTAFGESGAGFARASFSTSYERILEATNRIERYLDKVR
ncbi:aminotransferase class I/II-fold pyridoxal phosphate-dependent enzyme [Coraliomargarita akajimensis]|uniref:Aminotransferase n=1 Tax=Coraliomargarita akajimensis (strain DSM 45221 / IAM 15411 / JCM 23193 / KCTC 12865 / 04OKA010-24) TaxID=583355 RepID=D5EKK8_CORAD|nr:aminotransferase class I/II-fold pyridoxal phosphate-dependent enzyme [Coraliomargarita akajimensis]ADE54915.1 aminotransferase class I and II [Coraliomargarita akajimensis DSM 45221]